MNPARLIRTVAQTLIVAFALLALFGAAHAVDAREFKVVKLKAITAADFAEGCAMEGGILNEKRDNAGYLVESSCTEGDNSAADCNWGTRECRVYPPERKTLKTPTTRTESKSANELLLLELDGGGAGSGASDTAKITKTPTASR
jgi:hypothetical protein